MTNYEIGIMLHYYCRIDDHPDYSRRPPIWDSTINRLCKEGMLRWCDGDEAPFYAITGGGRMYVEALQAVPIPVQRWVMPPLTHP